MTITTRPRSASMAAASAGVLALAVGLFAAPAHGVPPPNDDVSGALRTTTEPSTVTFDTTEATSDPTDGRCVGDKSVWYRFTAPSTGRFRLTTAGSSFDTRIAVFQGRRNHRRIVDCDNNNGPGRTSADHMRIHQGQLYWIAVSSCCGPSPVGGPGVLTITDHPVEPGVDLEVEGADSGAVSGRLFVFGSMTCATPSEVDLTASASQRVGENVARGDGWRRNRLCGEDPVAWRVGIDSTTGWAFQPGPVSVRMTARLWDGISSGGTLVEASVIAGDDPDGRRAR